MPKCTNPPSKLFAPPLEKSDDVGVCPFCGLEGLMWVLQTVDGQLFLICDECQTVGFEPDSWKTANLHGQVMISEEGAPRRTDGGLQLFLDAGNTKARPEAVRAATWDKDLLTHAELRDLIVRGRREVQDHDGFHPWLVGHLGSARPGL
ncbi:MAG: hypothetical protein R2733_09360 [Acidimicrobiales bacterium]